MARAQSQYLRIYDSSGVTYARWQSYYVNTNVTWDTVPWIYIPFEADGITEGSSGEEAAINITAPATSVVTSNFEAGIREGRLAELRLYQFEQPLGDTSPPADQQLVTTFNGQIVGGSSSLTRMTIQLGSALSPIGVQVPPRKLTTAMIGLGCKL